MSCTWRNIRKVSKPHRMIVQHPAPAPPPIPPPHAKIKALLILAENSRKTETKLISLCATSHEN